MLQYFVASFYNFIMSEQNNKIEEKKGLSEKTKQWIRIVIAVFFLVLSVYYTVKDIDFSKLWYYIINANYLWVLLSMPVMVLSHWVRAYRWRTMLQPVKKNANVWDLFSAVMAGYAVNNVLPRGGEFVRPYFVSRREKISYTSTFATIVVERFLDVLILLIMFSAVWFTFREQIKQVLPTIQAEKLFLPVVIFLFILILSFWPRLVRIVLKYTIKLISKKFYRKISELFEKFAEGMSIVRTPSQYFRLTVESLAIWLLYTIPMWLMFFSFGFQNAPMNLHFEDAILLIVISGIAFSISPTPGAIGVYHFLIQNTLVKLYGIGPEEALAYATVTHGIGYIIQVGIGGLFLVRENIKKIPTKDVIESKE